MRTVKAADERKDEIIDAAMRLFAEKGFDGTSTGDILDAVGIARGTLYYHFRSKEEILDAAVGRTVSRMLDRARVVAGDKSLQLTARLTLCVTALNDRSDKGKELLEQMHRPQNALMHQKTNGRLIGGIVPILSGLVEEGIAGGVFSTDFPREAVEMIIIYAHTAFDDPPEDGVSPEDMRAKMTGFVYNVERLLGAKPGSMAEALMPLLG